MGEKALNMEREIRKTAKLKYLLFLPEDYEEESGRKWPLILFLHGLNERGDDIEKVKIHGIPKVYENDESFPFIVVSPQCPDNEWWTMKDDELDALLDEVTEKYSADKSRIYLTGLSMGGFGTWHFAAVHPERFAAIAPICGGGVPIEAMLLKDVPVWAFHGAKDDVVPIELSESMVNALKSVGGDVKFTVYPEAKHDSWTETYNNPELYKWFLSCKKYPYK